jgi:hypothetical protein
MSPDLPSGVILCAERDGQLGGGRLLPSLMVAKGQRSARASSRDCNFPNASLPRRGSVEQGRANGDAPLSQLPGAFGAQLILAKGGAWPVSQSEFELPRTVRRSVPLV